MNIIKTAGNLISITKWNLNNVKLTTELEFFKCLFILVQPLSY